MSLGKKDIVKNISTEAQIPLQPAKLLLDKFIDLVCSESKKNHVKISRFGTFYIHESPQRIGRNPLTKKEYLIKKRSKLALKVSHNLRNLVN
tara:strand:+ start:127 stop:402 length:276 start_codon:yes stop_codon:yes gene_type:complete